MLFPIVTVQNRHSRALIQICNMHWRDRIFLPQKWLWSALIIASSYLQSENEVWMFLTTLILDWIWSLSPWSKSLPAWPLTLSRNCWVQHCSSSTAHTLRSAPRKERTYYKLLAKYKPGIFPTRQGGNIHSFDTQSWAGEVSLPWSCSQEQARGDKDKRSSHNHHNDILSCSKETGPCVHTKKLNSQLMPLSMGNLIESEKLLWNKRGM